MKTIFSHIMLLFSAKKPAQNYGTGYMVTIQNLDSMQPIVIHRLQNIDHVNELVEKTFRRSISWFNAKQVLEENRFFEIITERKSFYCEKKHIVGLKRNGDLKFKSLNRFGL